MKIQKWGNSLGLRIPSNLAQEVNIEHGTEVEVTLGNQELLVRPVIKKPTLEELLAQITPENRHNEVEWGNPEGNEMN